MKFRILVLALILSGCAPMTPEQVSNLQAFTNSMNQVAADAENRRIEAVREAQNWAYIRAMQQAAHPIQPLSVGIPKVMVIPAPQPGVIQTVPAF